MFTVRERGSGSPWEDFNLTQLIDLFPQAVVKSPDEFFRDLRESSSELPPDSVIREKYVEVDFYNYFDPVTEENTVISTMHHNIFNNPNISITPSSPSPKQPPIASTSRPPWIAPVSPPISIVPVSCEPDKSVSNNKETQKHSKRTAPYQISNRTIKHARLSITKPPNARKDNKAITKGVKVNQIKKNDSVVSNTNLTKSIPSTSNAVIQSTQEVASAQSTNEELQPLNSELNCKDNSSHLDNDKKENGFHRKYCLYNNEYLLHHLNIDNDDTTEKSQDMVELRTINEKFWFKQSLSDELLQNVRLLIQNKTADEEEFESIIKSSPCLQLPKVDCSSSTSTNSKSPASQNNINSINPPNQVGINKSQKQTTIQQQPSKQTIKSSNIIKQQSTSTNISSKMQHSTINQTDPKHHVPNNQHINTPLKKHTKATATHIQTSNKKITNNKQLPTSSKLVSTTKKVVNIHNVKKPAIHQPSINDVKKCIKCKALSKDETCAACHMSSHLKNVTVTRIGTPSTSTVVHPESPTMRPSKLIDVPSCSKNSVSCEAPLVLLLSSGDEDEEEEEEEDSLEPNITKMETKEALKKHTDKLCLNPKLLEDRLWQKDLSVKDYYKIEECHSVHIGSFKTVPAPSGDMLVCLHGIRMTIKGLESEPVTIDLQMDNVVKILGYHGENPLIIIYTNHLAAAGIQFLLNMNEDNKNHFYDPLSKDITLNKIVWFFNLKRPEIQHLEKLLLKLPKRKYAPLTINQVNTILGSTILQDEEDIRRLEKQRADEEEARINAITILQDRLGERSSVIKINDYKMLNSNEFINDILIEFYLNYWYTQKLSEEDRKRTYVFSTYFYTTLAKSFNASDYPAHYTASQIRHQKVKKWTKNVDIFKKDFVFIPINENFHWFMAVVCFPYLSGKVNMKDGTPVKASDDNTDRYPVPPVDSYAHDRIEADPNVEDLWLFDMASSFNLTYNKQGVNYEIDSAVTKRSRQIQIKRPCILLFDSLSGGVHRARITATLRDWLEQEYMAKYKGKKKDFSPKAIKGALIRVPQQPNYTDCGLFAIHFFKRFFERPIVDYTLPIRHLENWFSIDEVAKNCQKRKELQSIIFARMKERGSVLPDDVQLPILNFTDPPIKIPQNPHQKNTNPADVPNSTNRVNSPSLRPSTSNYQSNPNPTNELQHQVIQNNSGYNHPYFETPVYDDSDDIDSYDDDEVERQFDENDHYDEGSPENYQEDYNVEQYADLQNHREYFPENTQQVDDDVDPIPNSDDEQLIEYHQQSSNNGNLVVNDLHYGLSNRRNLINIQNISNENRQSFRPNIHDYDDYEMEGDDDYEIEGDDDGDDDGDEEIDEEEEERNYNESNSTTNHNRRKIHFNHSRLSN
ncbi:uncharacterized protein LOC114121055 isoform X2 [Aphis gossypii]|uniref:uncharacterized protein LOC114121055 isoform X2 n=1 Tax=Aphis gossypii TaxID=80765 RepID=UPI00215956F9|nr:uncharacterized protein LOC114121055 isoform X2 [Aphis gossypii]